MTPRWTRALRAAVVSGSVASVASAAALIWRRRHVRTFAPVNAPSHWLWGDVALRHQRASLRYTAVGFAIHHLSSMFWGTLHAAVFGVQPTATLTALRQAALTAAFAAWVDLRLVPHRLTPGFQHHLSRSGLAAVYALFAAGLAGGHALATRTRSLRRPPLLAATRGRRQGDANRMDGPRAT